MLLHRARDIHKCLKSIGSFTDNQAKVIGWDSDHLEWITIQIFPKSGPYTGARYDFMIRFDKQYPKQPPQVDCITPIYHPNIDMTAGDYNVCLNLFDEWRSSFGLEDIIQGLLFLLYYPNLEDPLSPWFDPGMDAEEFAQNVRKTLHGEGVEDAMDCVFPQMIEPDDIPETKSTESAVCDATSPKTPEASDHSQVVLAENNTNNSTASLIIDEKCSSVEELVGKNGKTDNDGSDSNSEDSVDEEDTKGTKALAMFSPGATDINSNESDTGKAVDTGDQACSHTNMVTHLENNFLTGFSELMAIDLFSDEDSDESSEEFYDDFDTEDDEISELESDQISEAASGAWGGPDRTFLSAWKDKMYQIFQAVIDHGLHRDNPGLREEEGSVIDSESGCPSVFHTCVDTGNTYLDDIELDEEEYLFLLSRNQSQMEEKIPNDALDELRWTTEDCASDAGSTSVFTDATSHTNITCDSTTNSSLKKFAFTAAFVSILAKVALYYRITRTIPIGVFAYYAFRDY